MPKYITRRDFLSAGTALASAVCGITGGCAHAPPRGRPASSHGSRTGGMPIPVILDSDIGDDIDDTWALLMLLKSPQLDLKMVVSEYGNATYRCRLFAKLLQRVGRTDVAVALGLHDSDAPGLQSGWIGDYRLSDYPGKIHRDGVGAMIDTIMRSPEPVTVLGIGPVMNIAEALRREPAIAENARFIGMQGSIRIGYNGAPEPAVEWNVKLATKSLQQVFAAPWDCTITPLDTCGLVRLTGDKYQRIYSSDDTGLKALIENYRVWLPGAPYILPGTDVRTVSTTLFDTVAVYLAMEQDIVVMEDLPIRVTDDGFTVIDQNDGQYVHCATGWKDLSAFEDRLVSILTS